ncbi:MAG: hypothetical protein WBA23_09210 [Tunicatimonas sp.]|uniref:hypothetical protein n=1 Tax=Tunicatimonas sp. TaxID=1940096 RepID=UPI003C77E3BD
MPTLTEQITQQQQRYLSLLNKHKVDYLTIGNLAMRKYDELSWVGNIAVWVKPDEQNYAKLKDALAEGGKKLRG